MSKSIHFAEVETLGVVRRVRRAIAMPHNGGGRDQVFMLIETDAGTFPFLMDGDDACVLHDTLTPIVCETHPTQH